MLFNDEEIYENQTEQLKELFRLGGFPHRLPKNGVATKVFKQSADMLLDLRNGSWITKWPLDQTWLDNLLCGRSKEKLVAELSTDTSEKVRNIMNIKTLVQGDKTLFPRDKSSLDCDFPDFLCNPRTGKSWFLYFVCNGVQTLKEQENARWVQQIPTSYEKAVRSLSLFAWDAFIDSYAEGIVRLFEWYKQNRKQDNAWMNLYRPSDFWVSYLSMLDELLGGRVPEKGHFLPDSNTHKLWRRRTGV